MRNLKRALSLAVASVMLLGMMIVGTGAVSVNDFGDADQIASENLEAATITTGLGIFAGADGNFLPDQPVTRAEMATIICKMLYGNDVNADNFKGAGTFQDTASYQSGWAEGYINMCASLGIVSGYNETAFGPGDTVTTWQASLMLQRALGYWAEGDPNSINELAVTTKGTQLGMYGDLTLSANAPLSREDVAVMAFNALFAQRVAYDDYRGLYVKANDRNVVVTNGTDDELNTLAQNTYGLYMVEGVVTANGYTDEDLSESLIAEPQTALTFTEETDLDKDGKFEYNVGDVYEFEVGTDLDMIGHAATIYYTIERKAPVVYAIVDDATLVSVIDYDSNTTRLAQAANDAGFRRNTVLDIDTDDYILNYDFDTTVEDASFPTANLDKLILISNSGNYDVDYVIALDQYLDTISMVDEDRDGTVTYELRDSFDGTDMNAVTEPLDEDDFVIVTDIGNLGEVKVLQPATLVGANITKITGVSNTNADVTRITADGEYYYESSVTSSVADDFTVFVDIDTIGEATLVLDQFGDLIGLAEEAAAPSYAYVAQYGVRHSTGSLNTTDALTAHVYFADGTNGVYEVNSFDGVTGFVGEVDDLETADVNAIQGAAATINDGNGQTVAGGALGIWDVTIRSNGKIDIDPADTTEETDNGQYRAASNGTRLVKGHSTFVYASGNAATGYNASGCRDRVLYQNNDTVYFYVNNNYDDSNFSVDVFTGVKNVIGFTNGEDADTGVHDTATPSGIRQVFATAGKTAEDRCVVGSVLVEGVDTGTASVYYYNTGNYHYSADGLVYELYDLEGNLVELTYEDLDESDAASKWDGFYVARSNDIEPLAVDSSKNAGGAEVDFVAPAGADKQAVSFSGDEYVIAKDGDNYYIINDDAEYDEYVDNLYTDHDTVGTIAENPVIVDACDSGLDTLSRLVRAIREDGNVKIAFFYNTDDYVADVIYVSDYDPDGTEAPGGGDSSLTKTLKSVKVGGVNQEIAGAYGSIAEAISNAVEIKLPHDTSSALKIDIDTTDPLYYGDAGVYGNAKAARDSGLVPGGSPIDTSTATMASTGVNVSDGSYLLISVSGPNWEIAYYADRKSVV